MHPCAVHPLVSVKFLPDVPSIHAPNSLTSTAINVLNAGNWPMPLRAPFRRARQIEPADTALQVSNILRVFIVSCAWATLPAKAAQRIAGIGAFSNQKSMPFH